MLSGCLRHCLSHLLAVDSLELNVARMMRSALLEKVKYWGAYKIRVAFGGMRPGKPLSPYA